MRINKISLAGVALALVGAGAKDALADTTVSTATTTPLQTSAAGNVTVTSGGSIAVTAGQAAVTVNSNNTVTNGGLLSSKDANNSTGIAIQTTGVGSPFTGTVTNNGPINLTETYVLADTDGDGDFDGPYAQGTNRVGIWLEPGGSFNGDIIQGSTSSITIQANNSTGVRLDGLLHGNLSPAGTIAVVGDNSQGIAINGGAAGGVTGNVSLTGAVAVRGQNTIGVLVDAPIGGALNITANITDTGFHSTSRPLNATAAALLDADDFLLSGPAVAIQNNVVSGVSIINDTANTKVGSISSFSNAPALLIRPNVTTPTNVLIGATASGFGLVNQGVITANSIFDGFDANAVRIQGSGAATVNITGGIQNVGNITSTAFEGNSTSLFVGVGATVPSLTNLGGITAVSNSQTVKNAVAIDITGGTLGSIVNGSSISAQVFGSTGNAIGIRDQSNSLLSITNNGSITAQVIATDADPNDNLPAPPVTGSTVAIDVSASTNGVTLIQQTPTTAAAVPLQILGDVRFGSGADTFNLLNGTMLGNLSFGAGADTFLIDNGASFAGKLTDADGVLNLNVANGTLGLAGGTTNLTTAHFGSTSVLGVLLSTTPANSTFIHSTGTITFDAGSVIAPVLPVGLPTSGTNIFLTAAGGLVGASNVVRTLTGANTPFIYNVAIQTAPSDPNSLQTAFILKTPTQLGLTPNQTIAFQPVLAALRTDANASAAFSSLDTQAEFENAYTQMLPNYASAAAELAATAIQQSQGATANRLDSLRIHDSHDISVWGQEIGYQLRRDPKGLDGVRYDGWGFGLAVGIDGPLRNGQMFGLSASLVTSETSQPARRDGELSSSIGQFNAYLGSSIGPVDLDMLGGVGVARLSSRRFVEFGTFKAQADADWWAGEGHAAIRASVPMQMASWLEFRPYTNFIYVGMNEQGYKESGGGTAINLDVDGTFSQRLWADAGVEFAGHFGRPGLTQFSPRMTIGYRANLIDDAAQRTLHFESGTGDFTLTDATEGEGGAILGLGVEASNGYSTFSLNYEGQFSDQIQRNSINAALRFRF